MGDESSGCSDRHRSAYVCVWLSIVPRMLSRAWLLPLANRFSTVKMNIGTCPSRSLSALLMAFLKSAAISPPSALSLASRRGDGRSEEHTSELQSLMRISYAVFCLKKNKTTHNRSTQNHHY